MKKKEFVVDDRRYASYSNEELDIIKKSKWMLITFSSGTKFIVHGFFIEKSEIIRHSVLSNVIIDLFDLNKIESISYFNTDADKKPQVEGAIG